MNEKQIYQNYDSCSDQQGRAEMAQIILEKEFLMRKALLKESKNGFQK